MSKSHSPNLLYARFKAACLRHQLPPGDLVDLEKLEKDDRYYLLHLATQLGPIFKAKGDDRFWTCIVGLTLCRKFLQAHASNLHGYMHDLEPLVPMGALRRMEGEVHRRYRKALLAGMEFEAIFRDGTLLHEIVAIELSQFAASQNEFDEPSQAYTSALNRIATASLVKVFFGANAGMPLFDALLAGYQKLGPFGLVWNIGEQQVEAFTNIRQALRKLIASGRGEEFALFSDSIAGKLLANNTLDDTLIGNLIYMVEMGRYDLAGLLRWLSRYAAAHPEYLNRLANEAQATSISEGSFTHAFVVETLRTDKSERLTRIAERDLLFEGYLIPRGTYVRLCLWESHHDEEKFHKPFEFNPERFIQKNIGRDQFAPFGLDHHRCPLADIATRLGIIFVRQLATHYTLKSLADGLPIRGPYHWEPALNFSVELQKRSFLKT